MASAWEVPREVWAHVHARTFEVAAAEVAVTEVAVAEVTVAEAAVAEAAMAEAAVAEVAVAGVAMAEPWIRARRSRCLSGMHADHAHLRADGSAARRMREKRRLVRRQPSAREVRSIEVTRARHAHVASTLCPLSG